MSDSNDLDLDDLFSFVPLPDVPSSQPLLLEDLEAQPYEYPDNHVPSNAVDYFGSFAEAEPGRDVLISESQTLDPTPHNPVSLVDDDSIRHFLDSSAWASENPSDCIDPGLLDQDCYDHFSDLLHDMPFDDSFFSYGETAPLNIAEPVNIANTTSSIPQTAPEGLQSKPVETHLFISANSEIPYSTTINQPNTTITSQKRKLIGPSQECKLPPKKKGGRTGGMTKMEKDSRTEMIGKVCITCRVRKQKCSGEIPCDYCLKQPKLLKQPCTKATFLDMVEGSPFFEFSNIYQNFVVETYDIHVSLEQISTTYSLRNEEWTILKLIPDHPNSHGALLTPWWIALLRVVEFLLNSDDTSLLSFASVIPKVPIILTKLYKEEGVTPFYFWHPCQNLDHATLFKAKLNFCASYKRFFRVYDLKANRLNMSDEKSFQAIAQFIDWLAVRYFELDIFSYLQKSANKLNNLSASDLYDFITSLVEAMKKILNNLEYSVMDIFPEQKAFNKDAIRQYKDRHKRLFIALLVYTGTAIKKIPSWSGSCKELEKLFVARFTEPFQDIFSDFESFTSKIQVEKKQMPTSSHCVSLRFGIRNEFVPKVAENTPGVWINMFVTLVHIDWKLAVERFVSGAIDKHNMNDILFGSLTNALIFRLHLAEACSLIKAKCAEDGSLTEACIQEFESHLKEIVWVENPMKPEFQQKRRRQVFLRLREGLRWLKLKSLVCEEEIYLLDKPMNDRKNGRVRLFGILLSLEHGNDEEFDRAIKLFESSQSWIRKACMDLRGIVSWITDIIRVYRYDRDTALSLSQSIQKSVDYALQLNDRPSKCDTSLKYAASSFGYSPDVCTNILCERGDNLDFTEATDKAEDETETALLIKSTQKLLRELRSADKRRGDA